VQFEKKSEEEEEKEEHEGASLRQLNET